MKISILNYNYIEDAVDGYSDNRIYDLAAAFVLVPLITVITLKNSTDEFDDYDDVDKRICFKFGELNRAHSLYLFVSVRVQGEGDQEAQS